MAYPVIRSGNFSNNANDFTSDSCRVRVKVLQEDMHMQMGSTKYKVRIPVTIQIPFP
jgi:hypothetical protein